MTEELYGTRAIREARLEAFGNRTPDRDESRLWHRDRPPL